MTVLADCHYLGTYLWEDTDWRHSPLSPACQAAGFLSLLSNQVSAFIVCLITLERFLVTNEISSNDSTRTAKDYAIARRLITVVVSDFLCWFPVGLLGLLAANDVPVLGEANVLVAVFVLPLN
nr:hypothetical protein BaRGS_010016 [Batillaria attramentaria]